MKPWGTGHAVLCCKDAVRGNFAAINADDFYGATAYVRWPIICASRRHTGWLRL